MTSHDHSRDKMVWCDTHQHQHIASIPRFTFACKSCAFGSWFKTVADVHSESYFGHETYEVEHILRPLPAEELTEALSKDLGDFLFNNQNWPDYLKSQVIGRYLGDFKESLVEAILPTIMENIHPFDRGMHDRVEIERLVETALGQKIEWYGTSYFDEHHRMWIRAITLNADGSHDDIAWIHVRRDGNFESISDRDMQMMQLSRKVE